MSTIVLPLGVADNWQAAISENTSGEWDALATDLLRYARAAEDRTVKSDLLTLALVACEHSMSVFGNVQRRLAAFAGGTR